jgi:FMNH2-dependent dimethyl sulfone monooxygenase
VVHRRQAEHSQFLRIPAAHVEQGRRDPNIPPELYDRIKRRMVAGWDGYSLVGTAEQIVDELGRLSRARHDGVVLSWVNYHDEMRQWMAEVMPLVEQAGLRKLYRPMP